MAEMDTVRVKWGGAKRFIGSDDVGHGVVMDVGRDDAGEGGTGPRPLSLALYALGGCTGIDVIGILIKQRQAVSDFEIVITAEQREEQPRRYAKIDIEYIVTGKDIKGSAVSRAVELSEEKYCSVRAMLTPDIELSSSWRIVESAE
jgi:putative redox protein